jgi:hypothetical protein
MTATFQKLIDANIQLLPLPEVTTHFVFERDGFVALVERMKDGFGAVGTAGLLVEKGLAPLVWRGDSAFFVAKGLERPATNDDVRRLRAFQEDLVTALT